LNGGPRYRLLLEVLLHDAFSVRRFLHASVRHATVHFAHQALRLEVLNVAVNRHF
jgi:hypothetical protein